MGTFGKSCGKAICSYAGTIDTANQNCIIFLNFEYSNVDYTNVEYNVEYTNVQDDYIDYNDDWVNWLYCYSFIVFSASF